MFAKKELSTIFNTRIIICKVMIVSLSIVSLLFNVSVSVAVNMTTETVESTEQQKANNGKPEVENAGSGTDSDSDDAPDLEDPIDADTAAAQSQVPKTTCILPKSWRFADR